MDAHLPTQDDWLVPTLVQYEIHKWLARSLSADDAEAFVSYSGTCIVVPLTTDVAIRGSEVSREHGLSTADAIIYATALEHGADLLTCDAHFEGLPQVVYLPKANG